MTFHGVDLALAILSARYHVVAAFKTIPSCTTVTTIAMFLTAIYKRLAKGDTKAWALLVPVPDR